MDEPGYYRHPTIHADTIAFVCEDDLWSVPVRGGLARRLTVNQGDTLLPRFSPDGSEIAFVGREEGHLEVYVIPSEGGVARRVTYLGAETCQVCAWTPDGKEIVFVSDATSAFFKHSEAFAVRPDGGMPRALNLGHVRTISLSASGATAIGRNNLDPAVWKRYRGGTAGDIWVDATGKGKFKRLISIPGNHVWPMWLGGRVYFLSDHEGVANIYSVKPDGSDLRRHTHHSDYFVRFPSTDGRRLVYTAGADLYVFDPKTDRTQKLDVVCPITTTQSARRFVEASRYFEGFDIHPDGHSLAVIARGQPFTMPFWEEAAVHHGAGSRVRYRFASWLKDGKRFVVVNDASGIERIELHVADQTKDPVIVSKGDIGRLVELAVSPQDELVAFANHRYELMLLDLKTRQARLLDRSPMTRISGLAWSPDGRWLAYSWANTNDTSKIRLVDVKTGEVHDVTDELRRDRSPFFDPEGKHLYFLSTRDFNPVYDALQFDLSFPQATRPFLVTLRKDVPDPFVQRPRPFIKQERAKADKPEKDGRKTREAAAATADGDKPVKVEIDFEGISGRILGFPVEEGCYEQIVAARGRVLFTQYPVKGIRRNVPWWKDEPEMGALLAYDFEEQRAAVVAREVSSITMSSDCRTLVYVSRDNKLRVFDALEKLPDEGAGPRSDNRPGRRSGWFDLCRVKVMIEPREEWKQMYDEAWRLQKEQFWDERMSNVDWDLVYERYAGLLFRVRTRGELSDLIWEMQGELGTSHAYEMLGDYRPAPGYYRGFLGADLAYDRTSGGYRIERILRGDSWDRDADSPLADPGLGLAEGDVIVAVNGHKVSRDCTVEELLMHTAGREVVLTVVSKKADRRRVSVRTLREERSLRYRLWVETNRRYVHENSDGKVGYLHIPDMGPWGFAEFHRGYLSEFSREALIVDVRYNRGGHVSPLLLEKLARKRVGYDVSRWGAPQPYPPESVAGPMVGLTNQFAGSDGDIFSHCFKLYKLGPLVGKRTWGGVVGIWPRHRLVDGTITTQPEFSFWFTDVGWAVENYGTDPDYDVDIAPQDYRSGRDPQLDKGLALALDALAKKPVRLPQFKNRPSLKIPVLARSKRS